MATDATFDNQLQALANATATFANGKDAAIKNTIITALGGSTQQGGGSTTTKLEPTLTVDNGNYEYNGDGEIFGYIEGDHLRLIDRTGKTFSVDSSLYEEQNPFMSYTVHLHATEGENYAAKTVTYTYEG